MELIFAFLGGGVELEPVWPLFDDCVFLFHGCANKVAEFREHESFDVSGEAFSFVSTCT